MAKSATIEESFEKLDKIVSQLEDGNLSMNDKVEKQLVVLNGSEETDDV